MFLPHKNAQDILIELTLITANHLSQIGSQVQPLVEDARQEALTLVLDIVCTVQKTQRFFQHRDIGSLSLFHSRLCLNHPGCLHNRPVVNWIYAEDSIISSLLFKLHYGSYIRSTSKS